MKTCTDLEPLLAPYVDGAAEDAARTAVDAHLAACPPCRDRVAAERAARELVCARRTRLRGCAPEALRRRCALHQALAGGGGAAAARRPFVRRTLVPLSVAASVVLLAGIFAVGFGRHVEVLAAQLAADHVKCFHFSLPDSPRPADAAWLSQEWTRARGWALTVPASTSEYHLELLGVRRCGSTDGVAAHLMYKWRGAPLSVYVMNSESRRAQDTPQFVDMPGQEAFVWKEHGRTYAVVAHGRRADLEPVVRYVKATAR